MALSEILETIRAESRATAQEILSEAETEAEKILALARDEAAGEEHRLAGSRDDQARLEQSRTISRAHLEAARARRGARERVFEVALQGVTRRIESLRGSTDYETVISGLLEEAIAVLPEATTVFVDPADAELTSRVITARGLDLSIGEQDLQLGGIVVTSAGRSVDNSLRSRLDRGDEHLRFLAGELIPGLRGGVR